MKDAIIFMSAYETTKWEKRKLCMPFKKKLGLDVLLAKYHLTYMLIGDKFVSAKGKLKLHTDYDYVHQKTDFSFAPLDPQDDISAFEEIIDRTGFCVKMLHAQSILADPTYFKIDGFICMEPFLAYIGGHAFQIDPFAFSINQTLIITFEVIDCETGLPIKRDEIYGKQGNYNLLLVDGYQYFGDKDKTTANNKISEIIYYNIRDFFFEMTGEKFVSREYSFIHNMLILSSRIRNIESYFCDVIGTRKVPSPLENISTTMVYQYYPQDGVSVITNYNPDNIDIALYNGILLEAIKLYVYLFQIINAEITEDMNSVIKNDLYLENLFFAPHVPIETHNLLSYIYSTTSFRHHKEATKLKISYMTIQNESKKRKNGLLLNVLLYFLTLIGAIDTLDMLEQKLNIPFSCSFPVVALFFSVLGVAWWLIERKQNKKF